MKPLPAASTKTPPPVDGSSQDASHSSLVATETETPPPPVVDHVPINLPASVPPIDPPAADHPTDHPADPRPSSLAQYHIDPLLLPFPVSEHREKICQSMTKRVRLVAPLPVVPKLASILTSAYKNPFVDEERSKPILNFLSEESVDSIQSETTLLVLIAIVWKKNAPPAKLAKRILKRCTEQGVPYLMAGNPTLNSLLHGACNHDDKRVKIGDFCALTVNHVPDSLQNTMNEVLHHAWNTILLSEAPRFEHPLSAKHEKTDLYRQTISRFPGPTTVVRGTKAILESSLWHQRGAEPFAWYNPAARLEKPDAKADGGIFLVALSLESFLEDPTASLVARRCREYSVAYVLLENDALVGTLAVDGGEDDNKPVAAVAWAPSRGEDKAGLSLVLQEVWYRAFGFESATKSHGGQENDNVETLSGKSKHMPDPNHRLRSGGGVEAAAPPHQNKPKKKKMSKDADKSTESVNGWDPGDGLPLLPAADLSSHVKDGAQLLSTGSRTFRHFQNLVKGGSGLYVDLAEKQGHWHLQVQMASLVLLGDLRTQPVYHAVVEHCRRNLVPYLTVVPSALTTLKTIKDEKQKDREGVTLVGATFQDAPAKLTKVAWQSTLIGHAPYHQSPVALLTALRVSREYIEKNRLPTNRRQHEDVIVGSAAILTSEKTRLVAMPLQLFAVNNDVGDLAKHCLKHAIPYVWVQDTASVGLLVEAIDEKRGGPATVMGWTPSVDDCPVALETVLLAASGGIGANDRTIDQADTTVASRDGTRASCSATGVGETLTESMDTAVGGGVEIQATGMDTAGSGTWKKPSELPKERKKVLETLGDELDATSADAAITSLVVKKRKLAESISSEQRKLARVVLETNSRETLSQAIDEMSDGSDRVDELQAADVLCVELKEKIAFFEQSLAYLQAQKDKVVVKLDRTHQVEKDILAKSVELTSRKNQLSESRERQVGLLSDLDRILTKSRSQLRRIEGTEVELIEWDEINEMADDLGSNPDWIEVDKIERVCESSVVQSEHESTKDAALVEDNVCEANVSHRRMELVALTVPSLAQRTSTAATFDKELMTRKWACGTNRWSLFLPYLSTEQQMTATLNLISREVLALDDEDPSGLHRRDGLHFTSLDVRCISARPLEDACEDSKVGAIAVKRNASLAIDPYVPICTYELSGECRDSMCPMQHIKPRVRGRILPRELLPLSPISLEKQVDNKREVASKHGSHSRDAGPEVPNPEGEEEDGFMPVAYESDLDDTDENVDSATASEKVPVGWTGAVFDKSSVRVGREVSAEALSMLRVVEQLMGCHVTEFPRKIALSLQEDSLPMTSSEVAPFFLRMVDCVRVSIHAGRHDIYRACCSLWDGLAGSWSMAEGDHPIHIQLSLFGPVLQTLKSIVAESFVPERGVARSPFQVAFEVQLQMLLVSSCVKNYCDVRDGQAVSLENQSPVELSETMNAMECAFAAGSTDSTLQDAGIEIFRSAAIFEETELGEEGTFERLLTAIRKGREFRITISTTSSIRILVDDVLEKSFDSARRAVQNGNASPALMLRTLILVSHIVFGVLESAVDSLVNYDEAERLELYSAIDRLLCWLLKTVALPIQADLVLCPLFAANASLGATVQLYNKVQSRLEHLLQESPANSFVSVTSLSELLMSQLMQLRASLPYSEQASDNSTDDQLRKVSWTVSSNVVADNSNLAEAASRRGIFPRHIVLRHDWNLTAAIGQATAVSGSDEVQNEDASDVVSSLETLAMSVLGVEGVIAEKLSLEGFKMKERPHSGISSSTVPQSVLLCGSSLVRLDMGCTSLSKLPTLFGYYFPKLEHLSLDQNNLTELPESMSKLTKLTHLSFGSNKIATLFDTFTFPELVTLVAPRNQLTELPQAFGECANLEVVHLQGNKLDASLWTLAAKLPRLRDLQLQS